MRYPIVFFDAGETLLGPRESFGATYARVLAQQDLELAPNVLETAMRESWAEISRAAGLRCSRASTGCVSMADW